MMFDKVKPYLFVVFLQFGNAGLVIIAKAALNKGMNHYTFSVYRNLIAAVVMAPFAIIFERKSRPRITLSIFFKIMLLGLLEPVIDQNLYYTGMKYTTATFSIAMCNIIPAMTFVMAWMCRLEKVNIRKLHGQGKIIGTLVTVGGAMIMTLVTGPTIALPWTKGTTTLHDQHQHTNPSNPQDMVKGSVMITAGCLSWACFFIVQAITLRSYPAEMSLTTLICAAGALQGTVLTLLVERTKATVWALHLDAKLMAIVYGGVICSGLGYYLSGVIMQDKGPVFVTAFNPLSMVIVAILGSMVLSEQMNLGRVLGAVVIVMGLYLVIWGKSKDENPSKTENDLLGSDDKQIPMTDRGTIIGKQDHDCLSITIPSNGETVKISNGNYN